MKEWQVAFIKLVFLDESNKNVIYCDTLFIFTHIYIYE